MRAVGVRGEREIPDQLTVVDAGAAGIDGVALIGRLVIAICERLGPIEIQVTDGSSTETIFEVLNDRGT